jgi:TonB family protein
VLSLWAAADERYSESPPTAEPVGAQSASAPADSINLEPIKTREAVYPLEAAKRQLQGQVWLKVHVSETGDVTNVDVISGDPILAKAAVDAAKKWKFKPFIKNGRPVEISAELPFNFAFANRIYEDPSHDKNPTVFGNDKQLPSGVKLVHAVQPVYPELARRNRIQGTVVLQATIGKDGRVRNLKPISGPKELYQAAVAAVQQWRYKPYLLNNEPVDIDTKLTIDFRLR